MLCRIGSIESEDNLDKRIISSSQLVKLMLVGKATDKQIVEWANERKSVMDGKEAVINRLTGQRASMTDEERLDFFQANQL